METKVDAAMVFRLGDLKLDPMAHVNHQLGGNLGVTLVYMDLWATHRSGRPLRINFMSRYICFSQIGPFDVSFEELFSKAKNPGGFFRKIVF